MQDCEQWSQWSSWGECSESCGVQSVKERKRVCNGGSNCPGDATEKMDCEKGWFHSFMYKLQQN